MDVQMMWLYSSEVTGDRAGRIVAAAVLGQVAKMASQRSVKFKAIMLNVFHQRSSRDDETFPNLKTVPVFDEELGDMQPCNVLSSES
jgi:hypothetical protein